MEGECGRDRRPRQKMCGNVQGCRGDSRIARINSLYRRMLCFMFHFFGRFVNRPYGLPSPYVTRVACATYLACGLGHLAALEHLVPFTTARPLRYAVPYRPSPSPAVPPVSSADSVTSRENDNQSFSNTLGFASLPKVGALNTSLSLWERWHRR